MLEPIASILYASDFGPDSRKAFRLAVNLARQHRARLVFLHVIESFGQSAELMINSYLGETEKARMRDRGAEAVRAEMERRIRRFADEELDGDYRLPWGSPQCRIEQGKPVVRILAVAREIEADLIIMGSRTHSAFSQVVVGSTAHQVLYRSDRPVLIVPMGQGDLE